MPWATFATPRRFLPLIDRLLNDEPPVRREAATALGRLKKAEAVPAILKALRKPVDRFEEHALIYALIEINDRKATIAGLNDAEPTVRRAALIALDQMTAGNLTREMISPLLAGDDAALLQAVIDILARHPDWADELDSTLAGWLKLAAPTVEQLGMIRGAVVALVGAAGGAAVSCRGACRSKRQSRQRDWYYSRHSQRLKAILRPTCLIMHSLRICRLAILM